MKIYIFTKILIPFGISSENWMFMLLCRDYYLIFSRSSCIVKYLVNEEESLTLWLHNFQQSRKSNWKSSFASLGSFVASSPIAVQNVAHRDRTAMGDIMNRDGRTSEHQSSCQGPRNSMMLGWGRKNTTMQKMWTLPLKTSHWNIYTLAT